MKVSQLTLMAVLFTGAAAVIAQDVPATQPSTEMPARHTRARIPKPYSELSDLTDDQKAKIEQIHGDMLAQLHKLQDAEKEQITAVLTDDQKKQLDELSTDAKVAGKKTRLEDRIKADQDKLDQIKPTTQPG